MLEHLDVPFRDASAAQLVWELDAAPEPWLARREVVLGDGVRLELRLLGASHQVLVAHPGGRPVCSELVACRAGRAGSLPQQATAERPGVVYRFTSSIERVTPAALAARATSLLDGSTTDAPGRTLVGAFPGSPHAVTAITVSPTGWRTWHVYPQTGEIVTTETHLAVRRPAAGVDPQDAPAGAAR